MKKKGNILQSPGFRSLLASLFAILVGLVFGFLLLVIFNPDPGIFLSSFRKLITTGFAASDKLAKVLYQAAPLIMTGLSVGFAFKTGLFNIGASGQYLVGAFCALTCGIVFQLPWYVAMVAAMIGGAIWGAFPGLFKSFFNVNEVITAIMFNWIALFSVNVAFANMPTILANYYGASNADRTAPLAAANKSALIPKLGLDELLGSNYMNISIFIAIILSIVMFVVLQKTTFGYELKACGHNRSASMYAGINDKRNIVLSMVIAGALAGIGGGLYYLAGTAEYTIVKTLPDMGFNGIPVALLAMSHPLGTIFSALFISYIQVGGDALQPHYAKETIDIIIAVIIYLAAFSLLMRNVIGKLLSGKGRKGTETAEVRAVDPPSGHTEKKEDEQV